MHAELASGGRVVRAAYVVMAQGYFRHVVSFTAPSWLWPRYQGTFEEILAGIERVETDELQRARELAARQAHPRALAALALAQAHAGQPGDAWSTLGAATARFGETAELLAASARLLVDQGQEAARACALVQSALSLGDSDSLWGLAVEAHLACDEPETAVRLLRTGLERFPNSPLLLELARAWGPR